MQLVIDHDTEYVNRSLPTASWWDRYTVKAGTYPIDMGAGTHGTRRCTATVDAVLLEKYRVDRLFTASRAWTAEHHTKTTVIFDWYAYEVKDRAQWSIGRMEGD